jgi:hypothetical protein
MEEFIEEISLIIKTEFEHSVCAGKLDTDAIAEKIWKWLINTERIVVQIPEGVNGCCEIVE